MVQKQCSADTLYERNMGMSLLYCKIQKHYETLNTKQKSLFDGFVDVAVSGSHTRHQDLLSSFLFIFSGFLLLDLEHDLKEVSDVSQNSILHGKQEQITANRVITTVYDQKTWYYHGTC